MIIFDTYIPLEVSKWIQNVCTSYPINPVEINFNILNIDYPIIRIKIIHKMCHNWSKLTSLVMRVIELLCNARNPVNLLLVVFRIDQISRIDCFERFIWSSAQINRINYFSIYNCFIKSTLSDLWKFSLNDCEELINFLSSDTPSRQN